MNNHLGKIIIVIFIKGRIVPFKAILLLSAKTCSDFSTFVKSGGVSEPIIETGKGIKDIRKETDNHE